jgi:hypothetical protein
MCLGAAVGLLLRVDDVIDPERVAHPVETPRGVPADRVAEFGALTPARWQAGAFMVAGVVYPSQQAASHTHEGRTAVAPAAVAVSSDLTSCSTRVVLPWSRWIG